MVSIKWCRFHLKTCLEGATRPRSGLGYLTQYPISHSGTLEAEKLPIPSQIRSGLMSWFEETWDKERLINRKLTFYNKVKESFGTELYLNLATCILDTGRANESHNLERALTATTQRPGDMVLKEIVSLTKSDIRVKKLMMISLHSWIRTPFL